MAGALRSAGMQQDPFGAQRAYYQGLLNQSYSNPTSLYNSPEYQSLQALFLKDLKARDAASGRNSQYATRATQAQNYFNTYLNNYRAGLQQAAGTGIAPNIAGLATASAQQYKNMGDTAMAGLNSIFG